MRTWRILEWIDKPKKEDVVFIPLDCPCGYEAEIESARLCGGFIIASAGMSYIFDPPNFEPPKNFLPDKIQCRKCGRIYSD